MSRLLRMVRPTMKSRETMERTSAVASSPDAKANEDGNVGDGRAVAP